MVSASMKNSESAFMVSAFWHIQKACIYQFDKQHHCISIAVACHAMHLIVFTDDFGWTSLPSIPVSHYYSLSHFFGTLHR
jgi:hypothetical protein